MSVSGEHEREGREGSGTTSHLHQKTLKQNTNIKSQFSAESLTKKTHFTQDEIQSLLAYFKSLTMKVKMERLRFREVMHTTFDCTDDVMLDRIFRFFDANNDGFIDENEWVLGLSTFLRGTLEEHINFCYFVYDINGDRSLAREELYHCLKNCLIRTAGIEEDVEESIKEIVEIALKKLDKDKNGQITFSDFHAAVHGDNLLLEACGPCLPNPKTVTNFFLFLREKFPQSSQNSQNRRKLRKEGGNGDGDASASGGAGGFNNVLMLRRKSRASSVSNTM